MQLLRYATFGVQSQSQEPRAPTWTPGSSPLATLSGWRWVGEVRVGDDGCGNTHQ